MPWDPPAGDDAASRVIKAKTIKIKMSFFLAAFVAYMISSYQDFIRFECLLSLRSKDTR